MKPLWLMRNRRGNREAPRLSLFPFLAVLICTMGALMLLLLFVSRQARLQAARESAAKDAEQQTKIAADMQLAQWRVDQLANSRKATADQLRDARLVLGHVEENEGRLRAQFAELSAQAQKADREGLKPGNFAAPGEEELRQLEGQIAAAQQRLALTQQAAANRPRSYAIVPYEGPNRTRRRPIYIECRGDAVVLRPENVVFGEADFDEPLGPGNPLAAAVRAAREQMLMERNIDPRNDGEPYPLLLVRPDGIPAYQCALAAMKSWGSDFGYELINADWQLKYPPPDPNVERAVTQAVELARLEHARLVAAAPSKYGKRPSSGQFRSSLAGGDEVQGNGSDADSPGFYSTRPADRSGQGYADGSSGSGNGGAPAQRVGNQGGPGPNGASGHNGGGSASGYGRGGFGSGDGGDELDSEEDSVAKADQEFRANNVYQSMTFSTSPGPSGGGYPGGGYPGGGYPGSGVPGIVSVGPGGGGSGGNGGFPGGRNGAPDAGGGFPGGDNGAPDAGGGYPGGGNGAPGTGGGYPGGGNGAPGTGGGFAGGTGNGAGGNGLQGSNGTPYGGGTGGGGTGGGNMGGGDMDSGGPGGQPGMAGNGVPSLYSPSFGQGGAPGGGQGGGSPGGTQGAAQPGLQSNGQAAYQGNGQPAYQTNGQTASSGTAAAVARPDGYIVGRPNDGNPDPQPTQRPGQSPGVAMVPATPLRPGEWRPSNDAEPPKPDPNKDKKKNPYDNVEPDHSQADWALRDARSHAAAISRPLHVDCYADRVVIAPDQPGKEPHVVVLGSSNRRNADKLVAAMWEIMDSWGMAGKEMYWRPVLNFYVAPGAEPRMLDLSRALDGSGLVIERKQ
jgi:hypothetical protein